MGLVLGKHGTRVEIALRDRIERGDKLANAKISEADLRDQLVLWDDYNRDLLKQLFEGDAAFNEYRETRTSAGMAVSGSMKPVLLALVRKLRSFLDRLPLAQLSVRL